MSRHISLIILAAGASRRMNSVKQLLPWGKTSLLQHVVNVAESSNAHSVYVVTGAHRKEVHKSLENTNAFPIYNADWDAGMGSSISSGIKGILSRENPEGILIMLCDQPLIDSKYLNQLIDTFLSGAGRIVGTGYNSKIGVPAVFGSEFFEELLNLRGDKGAGKIIADNRQVCISIDPKGRQVDVDTDSDYRDLLEEFK